MGSLVKLVEQTNINEGLLTHIKSFLGMNVSKDILKRIDPLIKKGFSVSKGYETRATNNESFPLGHDSSFGVFLWVETNIEGEIQELVISDTISNKEHPVSFKSGSKLDNSTVNKILSTFKGIEDKRNKEEDLYQMKKKANLK
jgi:hypothetical protein